MIFFSHLNKGTKIKANFKIRNEMRWASWGSPSQSSSHSSLALVPSSTFSSTFSTTLFSSCMFQYDFLRNENEKYRKSMSMVDVLKTNSVLKYISLNTSFLLSVIKSTFASKLIGYVCFFCLFFNVDCFLFVYYHFLLCCRDKTWNPRFACNFLLSLSLVNIISAFSLAI